MGGVVSVLFKPYHASGSGSFGDINAIDLRLLFLYAVIAMESYDAWENLRLGSKWFLFTSWCGCSDDDSSCYRVDRSRAYEEIPVNEMKGVKQ